MMTRPLEDIGLVIMGILLPLRVAVGFVLAMPLMALEACLTVARPYFPIKSRPSVFAIALCFLLTHFMLSEGNRRTPRRW